MARNLYIIAGCNGAGKTTASYTVLPGVLDCQEFVNADEIAKGLSPFHPETQSITAGRLMLQRIDALLKNGRSFSIETTLATRHYLSLIERAKKLDYRVTLLFFWLPSADMAIQRVQRRVSEGGHNIPEEVIRRRYHLGLKYFFHLYQSEVDYWMLVNNSSSPREVIATGGKDKEQYVTNIEEYQKIQEYVGARK